MLLGEFKHSLDTKGRIILPAKFREEFQAGLFLTKGLDNCLWLIPRNTWSKVEEGLAQQDTRLAGARQFLRVFYSGTREVLPDRQGRLVVPPEHRVYAGIEGEVVLVGAQTKVEMWSRERWDQYLPEAEAQYPANAEQFMREIGI